jgi:hypothetical protein
MIFTYDSLRKFSVALIYDCQPYIKKSDSYKMYYEEEDYSAAKSTTKKPIMSNSHTFFTSPVISSPIRSVHVYL